MTPLGRRSFLFGVFASLVPSRSYASPSQNNYDGVVMDQELWEQINSIVPTYYAGAAYYPCAAELKNGDRVDPIYFVDERHYIEFWGVVQNSSTRQIINSENIRQILPSRFRIPPQFASAISSYFETGMGYRKFYFRMSDGVKLLAMCGNVNDFFDFPAPYGPNDVVDVGEYTGGGEDQEVMRSVRSAWCLMR